MNDNRKFKLISQNESLGVWIYERQFLQIIKISYDRNKKLFKKLVSDYEYLTGVKFELEMIGIEK